MSGRGLALAVLWIVGCRGGGPPAATLLGGELGLDHVGIVVRDLRAAQQTFQRRLGFERPIPGRLPNGIDNVNFYFEDATYLEALTSYDRQKADWLAWFLDRYGEGGNFAVLSVRAAEDTAAFLTQRGFPMAPPSAGRIAIEGGRPGGTWRTLFFQRSPLPGSPLYFIEYPAGPRAEFLRKLRDPAIRRRSFYHRNTAVGLRAVWMAVPDLAAATRVYTAIGLRAGPRLPSAPLGAEAQVLEAGPGRHVVLFSPSGGGGGGGPVRAFLDRRGPGVLGVSVAVRALDTARAVVGEGMQESAGPLPPYAGPFGPSVLVPERAAHGTFIEFVQAR